MSRRTSLLTALRKYHPDSNRDPLENFVTEAFAWLLMNHPKFSRHFLNQITAGLKMPELRPDSVITWSTQVNLRGKLPDLVADTGGMMFIFEHKVGSHLHESQLPNYHRLATETYGEQGYKLILITGGIHQHGQNPDLALCWRDVHRWIGDWKKQPAYEEDFLFDDFCRLLEEEGIGPPAPVSHDSILAYLPAQGFEAKVHRLAEEVSKHNWSSGLPEGHANVEFSPLEWGRVGFYLTGRSATEWCPGLYAGFLLKPDDHSITWMNPACPDFTLIISFDLDKRAGYEKLPLYQQMVAELKAAVEESAAGFQFHHQLYESTHPEGPNRWHPIHIRKPMLELLRGTVTAEDQAQRVVEQIAPILHLIRQCRPFWQLRDQLRRVSTAPESAAISIS